MGLLHEARVTLLGPSTRTVCEQVEQALLREQHGERDVIVRCDPEVTIRISECGLVWVISDYDQVRSAIVSKFSHVYCVKVYLKVNPDSHSSELSIERRSKVG